MTWHPETAMACPACKQVELRALPHDESDAAIEYQCDSCKHLETHFNPDYDPTPEYQWEVTEVEGCKDKDYRLTKGQTR